MIYSITIGYLPIVNAWLCSLAHTHICLLLFPGRSGSQPANLQNLGRRPSMQSAQSDSNLRNGIPFYSHSPHVLVTLSISLFLCTFWNRQIASLLCTLLYVHYPVLALCHPDVFNNALFLLLLPGYQAFLKTVNQRKKAPPPSPQCSVPVANPCWARTRKGHAPLYQVRHSLLLFCNWGRCRF